MSKQTHTILVVDDEPANLRMLERLLRGCYRVLTALSGQEALEILCREKVSLLLTDQRMPGMTGIELLRASHNINSDLAKMMITANTDNQTFTTAINDVGALRVIHKPWDPETVLRFVKESLAQHETIVECKQANAQLDETMQDLKRAAESLNILIKTE